jgi:polygalacturonase
MTFLSGNIILKSNVTFIIEGTAVLLQSQDTTHYANVPQKGREKSGIIFDSWMEYNHPFLYAGDGVNNISITGTGTIAMTHTSTDATSIIIHAIGFHKVSHFTISNITIDGASAYNVSLRNSNNGEVSYITTVNPASHNSDGVSLMNCQKIRVHHNNLTTLDDSIYVWASYQDPRGGGLWWSSNDPMPTEDIEIDHNVAVNNFQGAHGFIFINWTAANPDQQTTQVSRVNVHDNSFTAPWPVDVHQSDPYHNIFSITPTKDITFTKSTDSVVR